MDSRCGARSEFDASSLLFMHRTPTKSNDDLFMIQPSRVPPKAEEVPCVV